MFLHLQNGYWIFSEKIDGILVESEMWYDNKLPGELDWERVIVRAVSEIYPKNRCKRLKTPPNNSAVPGELEPRGFFDDDDDDTATMDHANYNVPLILCVSAVAVLIIMGVVLVLVYYLIKRNKKKKEEPTIEKNVYYGQDDEYYDEHNNRVETPL